MMTSSAAHTAHTTLPADCLREIFKYIEQDNHRRMHDLFSCMLVNKIWCDTTVSILWKIQ